MMMGAYERERGHESFKVLYFQISEVTTKVKVPTKWKRDIKVC